MKNNQNCLKGIHSFYKLLNHENNSAKPAHAEPVTKGRSKQLIEDRNKCLFYRFYFYSRIHNLRYEDVVATLGTEFFLSERTVTDLFFSNYNYAQQIFKEKKTAKELEQMFQYLNWRI